MEFFRFPFELRRRIYEEVWSPENLKFHLYLQDGRLRGSICLGAELGHEPHEVRKPSGDEDLHLDWFDGDQLLNRLKSLWGPHYKCEEYTMGTVPYHDHPAAQGPDWLNMLLVCREM